MRYKKEELISWFEDAVCKEELGNPFFIEAL
jgi:hypothetical protein